MAEETTTEETSEETTEEKVETEEQTEEKVKPEDDWKSKSRKNETRAKKAERERDEMAKKLKDRDDANKSEQEKAIEQARTEARTEAEKASEKERRADRLEVAVTRLAAKGVTVGEGEDAKSIRFADAEDALLNVERAIRSGDIDSEDIYDGEGKIKQDALTDALGDLLKRKPHLAAGEEKVPAGDADARKGETADDDLDKQSIEDHISRKHPTPK